MKKSSLFSFGFVLSIVVALVATAWIHQRSVIELQRSGDLAQRLQESRTVVASLELQLERYRVKSSSFGKLGLGDIQAVKEGLKKSFREGIDRIHELDTDESRADAARGIDDGLTELLNTSDRLERTLFSRNAYQKEEVQQLHKGIIAHLDNLIASFDGSINEAGIQQHSSAPLKAIMLIGIFILSIVCAWWMQTYYVYFRPLRRLGRYAASLRPGSTSNRAEPPVLSGIHGDIITVLRQQADAVDAHVRERHKFVLDVVADLRAPLNLLQAGKALLATPGSEGAEGTGEPQPAIEARAIDSMRRGVALLSGSLDDFSDLVEIARLDSKLEERIIDLAELVQDVARTLAGPGFISRIETLVPPMPVWARVDARRTERVLIQLVSKVASTLRPGASVLISLNTPSTGVFRGIEIQIREADRTRSIAGGPELDLMKHWISEKGLNLALAHKIIRAQGGAITAAGLTGSSVQMTIRLPERKAASRGLIIPPTASDDSIRTETAGLGVHFDKMTGRMGKPVDAEHSIETSV